MITYDMQQNFEQAFSEPAIIDALIRIRLKAMQKRHRWHFLSNLVSGTPRPIDIVPDTLQCLPPRRMWKHAPKEKRELQPHAHQAAEAMRHVIHARWHSTDAWVIRLKDVIRRVQKRALVNHRMVFDQPSILCKAKMKKSEARVNKEPMRYRLIASYEGNLVNRLVITLTNRYLVAVLDPFLSPDSYAFRKDGTIRHHTAVEALLRYAGSHPPEAGPLYVAECDLKKFYDTIRHDRLRAAIGDFLKRLALQGVSLDPRVLNLVDGYLASYSFHGVALPAGRAQLGRRDKQGIIDQPDEALEDGIVRGLPQGGALSPTLANMLMHSVDEAVRQPADPDLFYARYCDDMIIMSPSQEACDAALERYRSTACDLGLIVHPPVVCTGHGAKYFDEKSKRPFLWSTDGTGTGWTWVSFVGYQIRRDGMVRIRKASVDKQKDAHKEFTARLLHHIRVGTLRRTKDETVSMVALRLIASSVGRRTGMAHPLALRDPCWSNGFRILHAQKHLATQLKALDQSRERAFAVLKGCIAENLNQASKPRRPGKHRQGRRRKIRLRYYGAPFSYFAAFDPLSPLALGPLVDGY